MVTKLKPWTLFLKNGCVIQGFRRLEQPLILKPFIKGWPGCHGADHADDLSIVAVGTAQMETNCIRFVVWARALSLRCYWISRNQSCVIEANEQMDGPRRTASVALR